jgi:hypothetical protein
VRALEIEGEDVIYPYSVELEKQELEQIDGFVFSDGLCSVAGIDIAEKLDFPTSLMQRVAFGVPYKVLAAVPTMEVVLLQYRPLLERVARKHFSELEWEY